MDNKKTIGVLIIGPICYTISQLFMHLANDTLIVSYIAIVNITLALAIILANFKDVFSKKNDKK